MDKKIYDDRLIERGLQQLENNQNALLDDLIISKWLDAIYTDEVLDEFQSQMQNSAEEFTRSVIQTLKPFAADEMLEKEFDALFDGIQVLPKCYFADFEREVQTSPIEARGYMVNTPRWILGGLKEYVVWNETHKLYVADLEYSQEMGMQWRPRTLGDDAWGAVGRLANSPCRKSGDPL